MGKNFLGLDGLKHFWSKAKTWIAGQITAEVTAKIAEIVANAPKDLDTLKEIADWISAHANDAAAMNTQINTNKSDISALKTSVAGKADKSHTHTKSEITDFPTSLPANGGNATKASLLDEYVGAGGPRPTSGNIVPKDSSEYGGMRKDVVTSSMTDGSHPGQDGHLLTMFWDNSGRYDSQFFVSNEKQPLTVKVRAKENEADYGPWVDLITSQNIGSQTVAKASTAGTADYARNMYYQYIDLSALDKTKFYPLVCVPYQNFAEVAICSESRLSNMDYNQNRIHFDISTQGWTDLSPTLNIREYACYQNNEVTIGCIGRGLHNGAWAIWLRGGLHYICFSRDSDLSLHTSDYTFGDETYTVGTNYYGGANSNVGIIFTPQSTITEGAYSSRPITAPRIKADDMMVIPIGAPSYLEDGCIWIER